MIFTFAFILLCLSEVESLVVVDGKCTGVTLSNGDVIHADKGVVLSGGVFGTAEILLRSDVDNEFIGHNWHHHRVMTQDLATNPDCPSQPEWQSYMAPSTNGFFRFRVYCTNEIGWM